MHEKLKERLFGGVVIVALTIIFVPMFFDHPVPQAVDPTHPLPESPDWSADNDIDVPEHWIVSEQEIDNEAQTVIFNLAQRLANGEMGPVVSPRVEMTSEQSDPQNSPRIARKVWAIQLAAFSDNNSAEDLALELRKNGYPAYTVGASSTEKTLSRVMVGPEIHRHEADNLKGVLKTRFNLEGLVVPYDPVSG
jgi:DedD protein